MNNYGLLKERSTGIFRTRKKSHPLKRRHKPGENST